MALRDGDLQRIYDHANAAPARLALHEVRDVPTIVRLLVEEAWRPRSEDLQQQLDEALEALEGLYLHCLALKHPSAELHQTEAQARAILAKHQPKA